MAHEAFEFLTTFISDNDPGGGSVDVAESASAGIPEPREAELIYEKDAIEYLRDLKEYAEAELEFIKDTIGPNSEAERRALEQLIADIEEIERRGIPNGQIREVVTSVHDRYESIQTRYV